MADLFEILLKLEGRRECVCGQPLDVHLGSSSLKFCNPDDSFVRDIGRCPQCDTHLSRHTIKPQEGDL